MVHQVAVPVVTPDTKKADNEIEPPPPVSQHGSNSAARSALISTIPESRPIASTYIPVNLPSHGGLSDFQLASIGQLADLVLDCVTVEGPVHQDRVFRTIAASFGIARVGSQVQSKLESALDRAQKKHPVVRRGEFLWLRTMSQPPVRSADDLGKVRPIREVAPEEIAAAVHAFLLLVFSINRDDLITAVARELGYDRKGSQVAIVIGDVLNNLVVDQALIDVGGQVRLNK
jgi:hypothetical protein